MEPNPDAATVRHLVAELETRMEERLGRMEAEIGELRSELHAADVVVTAARLRALNEASAHAGLGRLRTALNAIREAGIIDANGNDVTAAQLAVDR